MNNMTQAVISMNKESMVNYKPWLQKLLGEKGGAKVGELASAYGKPAAALGGTAALSGGLGGALGHHAGYESGGQDIGQGAWRQGLEAGRMATQSAQDNAGFFSKLFGQGGSDVAKQYLEQLAGPKMTQDMVQKLLAQA